MSTIKEEIIKSGRYTTILSIVDKLIQRDLDYPIGTHVDNDGTVIHWVSTRQIKDGVEVWLQYIEHTGEEEIHGEDRLKLLKLSLVAENALNIKLHNYANDCAHRKHPSEDVLEDIRAYEILNSSIDAILCPFFDPDTNEFYNWTIPNGWKVA